MRRGTKGPSRGAGRGASGRRCRSWRSSDGDLTGCRGPLGRSAAHRRVCCRSRSNMAHHSRDSSSRALSPGSRSTSGIGVPGAGRRAGRDAPRQRARLRGGAPARRGAGRDRSREDDVLLNVSHEFRTPLTLMLGPSEDVLRAARQRDATERETRDDSSTATRCGCCSWSTRCSTSRASRRADRGVATSRPTSPRSRTRRQLVSRSLGDRRRGPRRWSIAPTRCASPCTSIANVGEDRLNLLSNAFKFTFEGEITVDAAASTGQGVLEVRDTGVGIPRDELPRLFERFHRVPNARARTHEGTGIGLALVQELVRLHGGRIDVESDVGQRARAFTVQLPSELGASAARPASARPARASLARRAALGAAAYVEEALRWLRPDVGRRGGGPRDASRLGDQLVPGRPLDRTPPVRGSCSPTTTPTCATTSRACSRDALDGRGGRRRRTRRSSAIARTRARPRAHRRHDAAARRLRAAARAARRRRARATCRSCCSRRGPARRRASKGSSAGADDYLVKPFSARELVARVGAHLALGRSGETPKRPPPLRTAQFETLLGEAPLASSSSAATSASARPIRLPGPRSATSPIPSAGTSTR